MRQQPKHTPGPWKVSDCGLKVLTDPGDLMAQLYAGKKVTIYFVADCSTNPHYVSEKQAKATAKLISAAPDMYEAIKNWIDWMDSPGDGTDKTPEDEEEMLGAMRAAIAKATGTEQP